MMNVARNVAIESAVLKPLVIMTSNASMRLTTWVFQTNYSPCDYNSESNWLTVKLLWVWKMD